MFLKGGNVSITVFGIFIIIFLIILEILCILFKLTGLTDEKARFQVISIITGTGFTTKESELITQHKTRRRLAQYVMVLGYIGLATFISFTANIINDIIMKNLSISDIVFMVVLFLAIFYMLRHPRLVNFLDNSIERIILRGRGSNISRKNYYKLLSRKHGYGIYNIFIDEESFLVGKSILESELKDMEIQVLYIDKGDKYISFPKPSDIVEARDNVTVYGKVENIVRVFKIR